MFRATTASSAELSFDDAENSLSSLSSGVDDRYLKENKKYFQSENRESIRRNRDSQVKSLEKRLEKLEKSLDWELNGEEKVKRSESRRRKRNKRLLDEAAAEAHQEIVQHKVRRMKEELESTLRRQSELKRMEEKQRLKKYEETMAEIRRKREAENRRKAFELRDTSPSNLRRKNDYNENYQNYDEIAVSRAQSSYFPANYKATNGSKYLPSTANKSKDFSRSNLKQSDIFDPEWEERTIMEKFMKINEDRERLEREKEFLAKDLISERSEFRRKIGDYAVNNEKLKRENKSLKKELSLKSVLLEQSERERLAEQEKLVVVEKKEDIPLEKELELLKTIDRIKRKLSHSVSEKIKSKSSNSKKNKPSIGSDKEEKVYSHRLPKKFDQSLVNSSIFLKYLGNKHCGKCSYLLMNGAPTSLCVCSGLE